jgi:hypothetical protein
MLQDVLKKALKARQRRQFGEPAGGLSRLGATRLRDGAFAAQLRRANPRSALIIGMSAAEVGFKQCVGYLVPDAAWLANHVPRPP